MLTFDRFQLLAATAQISVVVLANADVTDVELISVRPHSIPLEEVSRQCAGRDMRFVGVLGVVDGVSHAQFAEPLDERRVHALAHSFAAYLTVLTGGDWAERETEMLNRLYALEVSRGED